MNETLSTSSVILTVKGRLDDDDDDDDDDVVVVVNNYCLDLNPHLQGQAGGLLKWE
jgi:hypothetical protein